jgi:hypothetical protein
MACRDEILSAIRDEIRGDFRPDDVIAILRRRGSRYKESTIRTHVCSRMCGDAPQNHAVVYNDLQRVGSGRYQLRESVT